MEMPKLTTYLEETPKDTSTVEDRSRGSIPVQPSPLREDKHIVGPTVGPAAQVMEPFTNGVTSRQQSPYSTSRSLIRDLTLPPYPNLDIPQSPPGSPPPELTQKFAQFLELKKQGVHFNDKLA